MTRDVAFVTYRKAPHVTRDDALALEPLAECGVRVRAVPWDDPGTDWGALDAAVVRSCWDYHLRAAEFDAWLRRLEAVGARVWNPVPVLRWNASKTYLARLHARGVRTVPTEWVARGARVTLREIRRRTGWEGVVVKPVVSASGYETWRSGSPASEEEERFARLVATSDVLVQPFLPEVERDGEWSLVFFGGEFSHAVVKRPKAGDFRVQPEFGGTVAAAEPPASLVREAAVALSHAPGPHLYARVDGCAATGDGALVLMELELLEPTLFFGAHPEAPRRFAVALDRAMSGHGPGDPGAAPSLY